MHRRQALRVLLAGLALPWALEARATTLLTSARAADDGNQLRLVFELSERPQYHSFTLQSPERVIIDFSNTRLPRILNDMPEANRLVSAIRTAANGNGTRVVLDLRQSANTEMFVLDPSDGMGHRLVIDLRPRTLPISPVVTSPTKSIKSEAERDIVVVIDAGHGGKDPGAVGSKGEKEKVVALAIAHLLARKLNAQRGFKAHLVRTTDIFVPLRKRVEIAHRHGADMFVSVHADAAPRKSASGASVYALSENGATSTTARWMADKENSADLLGARDMLSLKNKDPMVANVILDMSVSATIAASLDLGHKILGNVGKVTGIHQKRVEQAGFAVLKSPDIPSILVETGFISNDSDCRKLCNTRHQKRVAQAISDGIHEYFTAAPPEGTHFASRKRSALT
ncbi:N-acetylmuramoyl-L-alanine amidase [Pseudomonas putida]|uniref:N-acetylmuramoyl-L-alanine amidase n=1 Tax=Pseudomonas putida TaxID=303 RepID=UPI00336100D2